jgi:WD40 repeat protein
MKTGKQLHSFVCSRAVVALHFAADDKLLLSAGGDDENRIWDLAAGGEAAGRTLPRIKVRAIASSADGAAVTLANHNQVCLCRPAEASQPRCFQTLPNGDCQCRTALSADGRWAASGSVDGTALVHDVGTGKEEQHIAAHPGPVAALALSADGTVLASAGAFDNIMRLWDTRTGKRRDAACAPDAPVTSVAFHPDGRIVATADWKGSVRLWQAATGQEVRCLREQSEYPARCMVFSPDGKLLACGFDDCTIRLWDPTSGVERRVLLPDGELSWVGVLAFAPDSKMLAAAGIGGAVSLWDVASGKFKKRLTSSNSKHASVVEALAFTPDGGTLLVQPHGGHVLFWDVQTGAQKAEIEVGQRINGLALSGDGRVLAVTSETSDGFSLQLVELAIRQTRQRATKQSLRGRTSPVPIEKRIAFGPDSRCFAVAEPSGGVIVHDLRGKGGQHRFDGHRSAISSLAFAPDGGTLATAGTDGTVLLWKLPAAADHAVGRLEARELDTSWTDLASENAAVAYQALTRLADSPTQALELLRNRFRAPVDARRIGRLIRELDADEFGVRQRATNELVVEGKLAERALRRALEDDPSLEVRRRVEKILEHLPKQLIAPAELRALRSLELLEWLGGTEARSLLEPLAQGPREERFTREAQMTLERLRKEGKR